MDALRGRHVIAVPAVYKAEFRRDAAGALLQYGALPQRARLPFFTEPADVDAALVLPDVAVGRSSVALGDLDAPEGWAPSRALVAAREPGVMLDGLVPTFRAPLDTSVFHLHWDGALNTGRQSTSDRGGIALGRISRAEVETGRDPVGNPYRRLVRTFEVALAAAVVAPPGEQIWLHAVVRFILELK